MGARVIGASAVVAAGVLYALILSLSGELASSERTIIVNIENAAAIPVGTPLHLAGLQVGVVERRRLSGRYAQLIIRVDDELPISRDARLIKRTPSLLSGPILELDPGDPASGALPSGGEITRVEESRAGADTLDDIEAAMPEIQSAALSLRGDLENFRSRLGGEFAPRAYLYRDEVDAFADGVASDLGALEGDLERVESSIAFDAEARIGKPLESAGQGSREAREWMSGQDEEIAAMGAEARQKIGEFKLEDSEALRDYRADIEEIDRGEGTLGELVGDAELADDIDDTAQAAANFFWTLVGWNVDVRFRNEWNLRAASPRLYIGLRLQRRSGSFYNIEIEKGGRGDLPEISLTYDPVLGRYRRDITIRERVRFTVQWGKRIGAFAFRGGLKEGTFGAGADLYGLDDRLELSVDLFELDFDDRPRLKLAAAYRLFGHLYLLAGVDDALNPGRRYDIAPLGDEVPTQFEELYVGRDVFLGGTLRFSDEDLAALLLIGGGALASLE